MAFGTTGKEKDMIGLMLRTTPKAIAWNNAQTSEVLEGSRTIRSYRFMFDAVVKTSVDIQWDGDWKRMIKQLEESTLGRVSTARFC